MIRKSVGLAGFTEPFLGIWLSQKKDALCSVYRLNFHDSYQATTQAVVTSDLIGVAFFFWLDKKLNIQKRIPGLCGALLLFRLVS